MIDATIAFIDILFDTPDLEKTALYSTPALYTPVKLVDMTPRTGIYSVIPASYSKWVATGPVRDAHAGMTGLKFYK
jgi:hypothetical protein